MLDDERFDALLTALDDLVEDNARVPILVEGQRDVASLRALGCRGEVLCLHAGVSLMALSERLATTTRDVILLTDWDRKGVSLFARLTSTLAINNVRLHGQYRDRIGACLAPGVQDVESLAGYVERHLGRHLRVGLDERLALMEG